MTESQSRQLNVVCLASYFKGAEFIEECKKQGCRVILVTKEKLLREEWPRESLDEIIAVPNDASPELFIHTVSQVARRMKLDRIVALEEFDVLTAALIREHLRIPGMGSTTARHFRDKLAMRVQARDAGVPVPDFVHVLNYDELAEYMRRVPPPWVMKPRSDVSAIGIKKMHDSEQVWRTIDILDARPALTERSSYYLLEKYVAGDVYHVDSLVENSQVVFAGTNRYGRPPMNVAHDGGVFVTYTLEHDSDDRKALLEENINLIKGLGLVRGATHAEFIKSTEDGKFYFLEIAARVGGAYIAETLEAATGVNIWREWATIELNRGEHPYTLVPERDEYAGIALSLAKQEFPDTSAYTDPEIIYRVKRSHHVGLIVHSPNYDRVQELLGQYVKRIEHDFSAVHPVPERAE
ncbi:MAG TPA: ATP-grasp domain-containing protein [Acidobacteriota bacterium]|nr:ATP-grasp domain-containing protein [Acidobacteriota bacterium]HMZ78651.1 ATP-grasp domain-containing protein [Acidobacteriota bacterium]HNB71530.1 ATP-grasp domain-containing protein [Acidobacteriota bacterium]HND21401.1 ATP-grasp domain-containing protein [Acidobacteriota bacterium]